jgi:hypothetical protein
MSPSQVAAALASDELRVLQRLRQCRGSMSGARAFELRVSRDQVARLRDKGLVQVDGVTGDLELTPDGDDILQILDPHTDTDTNGDHRP